MYGPGQGRSRPRLPSGDGWRMPTPSQPPPRLPPPDNFLYQNPNNPYLQNLNSPFFVPNPTNYLPYNPYFQNPDLSAQNTNYFPQRQSNFKNSYNRKEDTSQSNVIRNNTTNGLKKNKLSIEMVDRVATKAHNEILETGENVSAWKVSQAVLLELKLDSWSDIGFAMQEIPTLYRLILTEGKVNAFIHCFVAVRRITSLYELEVGICKNEGVQKFDELEVGPLFRHPLVLHYFSMSSDVSEVVRITSEEIVSCLCEFMDSHQGSLIQPEDVLDFIAKKRSVISREKLGVRIQSLGMHISFIREARRSEDSILKKYLKKSVPNTDKKNRKRPLFSLEKKKLDERFDSITQRITSFSSSNERFLGKHIRFVSSSSDAECDDPESGEEYSDDSQRKFLQDSTRSSDRVSSCPYPSLTEEKTRLGLTGETNVFDSPGRCNESGPSKKKRKRGKSSGSAHSLPVSSKRKEKYAYDSANNKYLQNFQKTRDKFSLDYNAVMDFVTTWKEECHHQTVAKVSQSMMKHYDMTPQGRLCPQERKQRRLLFKTYPFIGLLNVAVHSIKCGMWDSIYDTFQAIGEHNCSQPITDTSSKFESIDVEPSVKTPAAISRRITEGKQSITVEDIAKKITAYFRTNHENSRTGKSPLQKQLKFLRNMSSCEAWLAEKFSVKEFKMLGQGDFCSFLENHGSLLPSELLNHLIGDIFEKASLEVEMLQNQLVFLVAQASNNSWEGKIDQQKISSLLMRQFPSILLNIRENVSLETFFNMVKEQQDTVVSSCVVFSSTLFGTKDYSIHNGDSLVDTSVARTGINQNVRVSDNAASKGAIDVLLRAPMLLDLHMWLHWDLVYSPSLGPLVQWLINEVNTKELLCMVMKDGSIIRINPSATKDSFFEALLHGSPFHAAVELLSLFASFGGKEHAPLSLLKSHARQAFEVMLKNSTENMEAEGSEFLPVHVKNTLNMQTVNSDLGTKLNLAVLKNLSQENRAALVPSRFILDCLICLPSEFRSLAADVLLSGLQGLLKEITSAVLIECEKIEHRLMLHEIGLSLGINEWIEDYNAFSRSNADFLSSSHLLHSKAIRGVEFGESSVGGKQKLPQIHSKNDKDISHKEFTDTERSAAGYHTEIAEVASYGMEEGNTQNCSHAKDSKDAALVIESIRREEFGLDSNMSNLESSMLKKQHARLGRALQCLSQELYSQDSHFLLELVQNADDNIYPENVEPTLTFILEEAGIVVLNNEQGFSAHNIRALCDVGNSTKKGCGSGYIGQKGIGFKSVFRVSDSPEIHSNGFHVKFDISQGQIGFVLPTIVPPCDIKKFTKLASADTDPIGDNSWNTCIVLPFKLNATGGVSNTIKSMFSDLHPSLLLFLHRLRCIKFRNMLDDSLIVMRKEIVGNGIIKVSHGNDNMTWLVVSQKLQANAIRPDVQTTEISLAFTLKESDKGDYIPDLNLQPVFAFLPLRTYGLKFILQGDFILPSSREEVDGDSSWNQWLLSEYPGLFVDSERSFCALPCFADNPGKAVTAYMSFVPLVGEVHGFFSSLSRMITSRLRLSNCLLQEGDKTTWVPPCKVLRNWNAKARSLLPDDLLSDYLGIGLLDKDIILSDSLSNSLGIEEYGPRILLQIISSLCDAETGLASVGLCWLCSWLNEFYNFVFHSSGKIPLVYGTELELISKLRRIPFIPLSDGTYVSMEQGTIWLQSDVSGHSLENELSIEGFRNLNTQLRTVSHGLLSAAAADGMTSVENITRLLHKIGVQQLSAHEIVKIQILPAISDDRITSMDKMLMAEYLLFVMLHLQSSCSDCRLEREFIISELQNKAFILTNNGYKRPHDVSIHLGKEYGNPIDIKRLIHDIDFEWNEVNIIYLKHPTSASLCNAQSKWREFFLELGVTDFVQIAQVRKSLADVSQTLLKSILGGGESISLASVVTDWESDELVRLLSLLSKNGNRDKCKYMLEILDLLWDNFFSEKVTGCCSTDSNVDDKPFKSSFMSSICDVQWIASSMDDTLHYSKDLFHDCDAVSLILGASAPYSVPKVGSSKLLSQIGFKTQVTIDDVLSLLHVWRKSTIPFKASIAQMSRFYSFIWKELASSRHRIVVEFCSGPFIFVPLASAPRHEDIVPGVFLSSEEVYWHDSTGCLEQIKTVSPEFYSKTLDKIYPGLYDFFVKECRVHEDPPALQYLQILLQLAGVALPSQAANAVFQVLVKWAEGLKSGMISSEEIVHLKERLFKLEFAVLPTIQDKWVSLHPSFGVVCWCDDEKLKEEFKHLNNLDFLYFGKISANGQELLEENVLSFLRTLGIPVLSELVTREAIHYGLTDNNFKTSLFNLALPYAQRYIHYLHPDKYSLFKQSIFEKLNFLQIVVVEKLYSRNAIKKCDGVSVKRHECDTLLQGNILYATRDSEPHPLFMELSRLFFDGIPELHLANFLHMLTTLVESGSSEKQIELILNRQKLSKLPHEEQIWSLSNLLPLGENNKTLEESYREANNKEISRKPGISSSWPSADWKTAPCFSYPHANDFHTQAAQPWQSNNSFWKSEGSHEHVVTKLDPTSVIKTDVEWTVEDEVAVTSGLTNSTVPDVQAYQNFYQVDTHPGFDPEDTNAVLGGRTGTSSFSQRPQLNTGNPSTSQAMLTGRLGEQVACKYFKGKDGEAVTWVNEDSETGLPYDIVIGEDEDSRQYIEVKATKSARKDWFNITLREWQFASEKANAFSIAHVLLSDNNTARITVFKNPIKLCQSGKLQLVVMMPKQQQDLVLIS